MLAAVAGDAKPAMTSPMMASLVMIYLPSFSLAYSLPSRRNARCSQEEAWLQRCCSATVGVGIVGGNRWSTALWGRSRCSTEAGTSSPWVARGNRRCSPRSCFAPVRPLASSDSSTSSGRSRRQPRHGRSRPTSRASAIFFRPARSKAGPGGYALLLNGARLDLQTFSRPPRRGEPRSPAASTSGPPSCCPARGTRPLAGPRLAGLTSDALRREASQLEELRFEVLEDRLEADLACGRQRKIVPELQALVAEHPFRERPRAQLMLALYRVGRSSDALEVYRETRRLLVEELGMEPGQELRSLEQAILQADPGLDLPQAKAQTTFVPERRAGTVTFLFTDVEGSTRLVRQLRDRYPEVLADHRRLVREAFARSRRRGGGHAGRRLLLRLRARPRRGGGRSGCAAGAASARVARRCASCAYGWGCTPVSPWSRRRAITGSASTGPRGSWRRATAARSWLSQATAAMLADDELPAWSSGISASSGSRTSTVPSTSTSSMSKGCPRRFRRSGPARRRLRTPARKTSSSKQPRCQSAALSPTARHRRPRGCAGGGGRDPGLRPRQAARAGRRRSQRVQDNAVEWSTPSRGRSSTRPARSPRRNGWRPGRARSG